MAGIIGSGIKWTAEKLSSLLPSAAISAAAAAASSSLLLTPTPSQASPNAAVYEDLRKLERIMRRIQSVLMDASQRDIRDQAENLRLKDLKEIAYDAEDVVSDYEYNVLHAKIQVRNRMLGLDGGSGQKRKRQGEVIDLDSIVVTVPVSDEIAGRVKEIGERFEETTRNWKTLGWNYVRSLRHHGPNTSTRTLTRPPSSSLVHEATIHGRDDDKENIIKQLLCQDGGSRGGNLNLNVQAIVGMGGIGKTTLAQLVYNDTRVRGHFELKGWVCVSDDFDVVTITRKIITSFTKKNCDFTELDDLQLHLQEEVQGKSFVLVLDDVWNEEQSLWDALQLPLKFSRLGTILVTSRSTAVAKVMQTKPPYTLGYLSLGACCSLFKQLVFGYQERDVDELMMQVAEKIVAKCNGLPRAVKAIGSVCRIEYDVKCWMDILESDEWKPNIQSGDCLPVLKLSYDRMPPPLKQCFAFFALFPKDYVFHADKITKLWMSVGLIHGSKGKRLEDIARDYINQLFERSMIQRLEKWDAEPEQVFVMHDLLHDLAELVSGNEVVRRKLEMASDLMEAQIGTKFDWSEASTVRYLSIVATQEDPDSIKPHNITLMDILQHFQGSRIMRLVQVLTWETAPSVRVEIPHNMLESWRHIRALDSVMLQ